MPVDCTIESETQREGAELVGDTAGCSTWMWSLGTTPASSFRLTYRSTPVQSNEHTNTRANAGTQQVKNEGMKLIPSMTFSIVCFLISRTRSLTHSQTLSLF